ncbi:hypothetical protein [Enterococcus wangshanyuanii]|uniref:Uncharacterized protein n=1 Tax=Enterococcus wangshanyuanii TaxID=2005703 RepID=A0ABQ1NZM5_9ENTE|nr:hypothetical protein [Enterococcus wangshanyuanii]GGC88326.1 hypothetical protein GCM10011573_17420 [Enterococcus wangshanyuanii]
MGAQMSQENVQALFDTVARIMSRDSGVEIKATVRRKDEVEKNEAKREKIA